MRVCYEASCVEKDVGGDEYESLCSWQNFDDFERILLTRFRHFTLPRGSWRSSSSSLKALTISLIRNATAAF